MRSAFIKALIEAARVNPHVYLVVGDLGYSVVESFAQEFPDRFINAGVAEQNMTGMAAGLALTGKKVFTYSIGNFSTLRCLEQIRNDVCYHNANVKIVIVGGGVSYGAQGMTHHATEDIAIMRTLPNMTVVVPGDPVEARLATHAIASSFGPCYLRLGKNGESIIHDAEPTFELGKAIELTVGNDVTFIACGSILYNAVEAAKRLREHGIYAGVLSMPTVKPLDERAIRRLNSKVIATVEEHSVIGGLGSAVAEMGLRVPLLRLGLPDAFITDLGSQTYIRDKNGLSVGGICESVRSLLCLNGF
jgi:transketolase